MIATGASPGRQAIVDFHPVVSKNGIPRRPIAGVQVDPCPRRSASRSTPWGVTTDPRWSSPAPRWRWRSIPTARFILVGDQGRIEPLLAAHPQLKARLPAGAHRRRGPDGRQAEPGAAQRPLEVVDVACHRRGQEGRGRRRGVRRQHRRADGDGQVQSENAAGDRASGDRGALADDEGHLHRARSWRLDRGGRGATGRHGGDGQRDGACAPSNRPAERGAAQHRRRGGQGPRGGARGRPHPARESVAAYRLHRLRRRRRHRPRQGRRGGDGRLRRQYRAQDRGGHGAPVRRLSARLRFRNRSGRRSAICWRGRRFACCATRWIRANRMAAFSSASMAS